MAQVFPQNLPPSGDAVLAALGKTLAALPSSWTMLRDRQIGGPEGPTAPFLLLHPEIGVALVDLVPPASAAEALQAFLAQEGFAGFYPGDLPVVAVGIPPDAIAAAGDKLADAFEGAPELTIADGDWVDAVTELLLAPEARLAGLPPRRAAAAAPPPPEPPPAMRLAAAAEDGPPALAAAPRRWPTFAVTALLLALVAAVAIGAASQLLNRETPPKTATATLPPAATATAAIPPSTAPGAASAPVTPPQTAAAPPAPPPAPPAPVVAALSMVPPPTAPAPLSRIAPLPQKPLPVVAALAMMRPPAPPALLSRVAPLPPPARKKPAPVVAAAPPVAASAAPKHTASATPPRVRGPAPRSDLPPIDAADLPPLETPPTPPVASAGSSRPPRAVARSTPVPLVPATRTAIERSTPLSQASAAPQPILAADGSDGQACRPYTSETTVTGLPEPVRGMACRDADGRWQLVSEVPGR